VAHIRLRNSIHQLLFFFFWKRVVVLGRKPNALKDTKDTCRQILYSEPFYNFHQRKRRNFGGRIRGKGISI
jgi:hypothetical protein